MIHLASSAPGTLSSAHFQGNIHCVWYLKYIKTKWYNKSNKCDEIKLKSVNFEQNTFTKVSFKKQGKNSLKIPRQYVVIAILDFGGGGL